MKDFLNYLLTIPQRIGIYFAKRRALRDHRRALEHKRKVELAQKGIELIEATFVGMAALLAKKAELEAAKRTKFPSGGIATGAEHAKGGLPGPEVDGREWFVPTGKRQTPDELRQAHDQAASLAKDSARIIANKDRTWTPEDWAEAESKIRKAAEQRRKFGDKPRRPLKEQFGWTQDGVWPTGRHEAEWYAAYQKWLSLQPPLPEE